MMFVYICLFDKTAEIFGWTRNYSGKNHCIWEDEQNWLCIFMVMLLCHCDLSRWHFFLQTS